MTWLEENKAKEENRQDKAKGNQYNERKCVQETSITVRL